VRQADQVLLFWNGSVVESGAHEELLANEEIYSDLVKFQLE
jgi:ABC-type multidrug transport system fused ATPase/permease subunit